MHKRAGIDRPSSPLLRRLASGEAAKARANEPERCELCAEALPSEHRHMVDIASQRLLCACRACAVLFEGKAAGGGHYRLVPQRRIYLEQFALDEADWRALGLPIDLAFFFYSTPAGRVVAFYPGPMGATESSLELDAWQGIASANPILDEATPDVEALLVNRTGPQKSHWLVPVDDCYRLVALIRTHWRGLSGGQEVWAEIGRFFDDLWVRGNSTHKSEHTRPAAAGGGSADEQP
jgi:hypothetical protein